MLKQKTFFRGPAPPLKTNKVAGGRKAHWAGQDLHLSVSGLFERRGYGVLHEVYLDGITDTYGKRIRVDIKVLDLPGYENGLIIQCRWQNSSGWGII